LKTQNVENRKNLFLLKKRERNRKRKRNRKEKIHHEKIERK